MKIAIDIRKIGKKSTGSEVYFHYLVKELANLDGSKKHQFYLLTDENIFRAKKSLGPLPPNFEIHKVSPTGKLLWTFYSLPRFLKKELIDVLHVEYIIPFYLGKNIKIVTTIHDVSFKANPGWVSKKDSLIMNFLIPPTLKRADAIIAVSNFSKKEIIKYYKCPPDKIFITHPAVDSRFFFSVSKKKAKEKIAKLINLKSSFILHISSLQPRKNVPLIIAAFAGLKEKWQKSEPRLKKMKLVIIGDKKGYNYDKGIDKNILRFGLEEEVILAGYRLAKELPYFYKAASAFIFPSSYEGFGIPIVEAMASETPIVVSNIEIFREVAGEAAIFAGINGKNKEKNLEEAIEKIIKNEKLREKKIKSGTERKKMFRWKELAEKTLAIYEKLSKA